LVYNKEANMEINAFGVVGAGQMGNGITQVAAMSGVNVIMNDIADEFVERGLGTITKNLDRSVDKGKISQEEKNAVLGRIKTSIDLKDMGSADYVVEAAVEREDLKFQIFKDLDHICNPEVILATNTSSIPIGRIAAQTGRPEKVIGMHFMNPVPVMKLVEVIRGIATSDDTFKVTWELAEKFGKTPALANDYPGFIANRILMPMINEAVFCLYQGVGTREDIDTVMKLGMNHPMGPLTLADLIGLDTCLAIMETMYEGFKDSKYRPCPLLRKYVEAGWLGRKTGRGFYEYK
jgi:3-hydroxybutyryl-CoA dehydrogenase